VGHRAVLDAMVKRKIPSPRRESNPRTLIVQPVTQRYTDCRVMVRYQHFKGFTLKMDTAWASEMLVSYHNTEDFDSNHYRHASPRTYP
jgi:hypothetical protein